MENFRMYRDKIVYKDGWFIYIQEDGNNSVLTRQAAHKVEEDYYYSQAMMDINRGGIDPAIAFPNRGFGRKEGYDYIFTAPYETDKLGESGTDQQVLETLIIPDKVEDIDITCISSESFANMDMLKEVILPESIHIIEKGAFQNCHSLQEVHMPSGNVVIQENAFSGTMALETDCYHVSYIGNTLIKADISLQDEYEIKDGTVSISDEAFAKCEKLIKIVIPDSVEIIGIRAFSECRALKEVIMPKHLMQLGCGAFHKCYSLSAVNIPEGIQRLDRGVFQDCTALREIHLPTSITSIGFDTFTNSGIMGMYESGEANALYIDNWLICYKESFEGKLSIRPGTIGLADSFEWDNREVSEIEIPDSVRYLGMGCFQQCHNITHIELPEGIEKIGNSAFRGCEKVKTIVFPRTLQKLDIWNVMDCESIEKVTFLNPDTEIIWPAIVNRRDEKVITVVGYRNSTVQKYCEKYGEKFHLKFKPLLLTFTGKSPIL